MRCRRRIGYTGWQSVTGSMILVSIRDIITTKQRRRDWSEGTGSQNPSDQSTCQTPPLSTPAHRVPSPCPTCFLPFRPPPHSLSSSTRCQKTDYVVADQRAGHDKGLAGQILAADLGGCRTRVLGQLDAEFAQVFDGLLAGRALKEFLDAFGALPADALHLSQTFHGGAH